MRKSEVNGLWKFLPEEWKYDFEEERRQWLKSGCSSWEWIIRNLLFQLELLKAIILIFLPNIIQYLKKTNPSFLYAYDLLSYEEAIVKLEENFRHDYFLGSIKKMRITMFVALITYSGFGYLDVSCLPSNFYISWTIRFVGCIFIILSIFQTFKVDEYYSIHQYVNAFIAVYVGCSISIMVAISDANEIAYSTYYTGLINVLICAYLFTNLSFLNGFCVGLAIIASYEYVAIFKQHLLSNDVYSYQLFVNNNFFLIASFFCLLIASNLFERYARQEFLTRYAVTNKFLEFYSSLENISPTPEDIRREIIEMRKSPQKFQDFLLKSLLDDTNNHSQKYLD